MKINIAQSAGFCSGVRRALKIARELAASDTEVYMLGDIVHNEDVVKELEEAGIKKIERLKLRKNKALLIRAHGASKKTYQKAKSLGYRIVDATCPKVRQIHKKAQNAKKLGYKVIVIGDKNHEEVKGITGQLKSKALVINDIKQIRQKKLKNINRAAVVVQSTQNMEKVQPIVDKLKKIINEVKFFNTICAPTKIKQEEARHMAEANDVMVIIGSKTSANTKRLYQISKSINKNTHWITSKNELKKEWFKNKKSVGITAGASTPDRTTREVEKKIKEITS
jgi:4-hydroxy-3-methylbut-2-en-1-yl diphosphate reductase